MAVSNRWKTYLRIFIYMYILCTSTWPTWHNNLFANFHGIWIGRLVEFYKLALVILSNNDFTKKHHDQFDCQQLNTTTNHTHPKSFTPELVTWTCMLWDTTVKKEKRNSEMSSLSRLPLLLLMDLHVTTAVHHHLYSHS